MIASKRSSFVDCDSGRGRVALGSFQGGSRIQGRLYVGR